MQERTGGERPIYRMGYSSASASTDDWGGNEKPDLHLSKITCSPDDFCERQVVVVSTGFRVLDRLRLRPFLMHGWQKPWIKAIEVAAVGNAMLLTTHRAVSPARKLTNRRYNSPYGHCCQPHFRGSEILQFSDCSLLCSTSTIELREVLRMV